MKRKNMYKMFGAVTIIGLFLIGSIASTGLAAVQSGQRLMGVQIGTQIQEQPQQQQQQPQQQEQEQPAQEEQQQQQVREQPQQELQGYQIPVGGVIVDYEDDAYAVPGFEPETLPYPWDFVRHPDLATGLIFRTGVGNRHANIHFVIRNYGLKASPGGLAQVYVPRKLHYSQHTILPKMPFPFSIGQPFSVGPFPFRTGSTVLVHIETSGNEPGIRGINWRVGYCVGFVR